MLLFTRQMDANGARLTTFLSDDAILGFPDDYVQQRDRHPMDWIAARLGERGLLGGTVGLEMDAYFFTPRAYEALRAQRRAPRRLARARQLGARGQVAGRDRAACATPPGSPSG